MVKGSQWEQSAPTIKIKWESGLEETPTNRFCYVNSVISGLMV